MKQLRATLDVPKARGKLAAVTELAKRRPPGGTQEGA
jgi:hypothetical protein